MHEISIAGDLARIVLDAAAGNGLSEVTSVNVSFGSMIQIVPEIFKFAFGEAVKDTLAEGAEVNIEILPFKARCRQCGRESDPTGDSFNCVNCGSTDLEIVQGKELFIKSIEGE